MSGRFHLVPWLSFVWLLVFVFMWGFLLSYCTRLFNSLRNSLTELDLLRRKKWTLAFHMEVSLCGCCLTLFQDSHRFSSFEWHALKIAIISAGFDDTFWRQTSLQQNFGSLWWRSLKTAIFDDSACLKRTLRGRFREKILGLSNHLCFVPLCLVTGNGSRTFLSPSGFRFQFVCVWLCFLCPWFSTAWLSNTFQTSYADQLARKQLRAKKTIIKMVSIDIKDCVTYNVTKTAEETRKLKMPSKILRTK